MKAISRHTLYLPYTFPLVDKEIKDGVMAELKRLQATYTGGRAGSTCLTGRNIGS